MFPSIKVVHHLTPVLWRQEGNGRKELGGLLLQIIVRAPGDCNFIDEKCRLPVHPEIWSKETVEVRNRITADLPIDIAKQACTSTKDPPSHPLMLRACSRAHMSNPHSMPSKPPQARCC